MKTYQFYVGGQWQPAADGATFEFKKPFSGELLARIPAAGKAEAVKAIAAAAQALGSKFRSRRTKKDKATTSPKLSAGLEEAMTYAETQSIR